MKLVTYEGDDGYAYVDGHTFNRGVEEEVSDTTAERCKASEEKFSVKEAPKTEPKKDD